MFKFGTVSKSVMRLGQIQLVSGSLLVWFMANSSGLAQDKSVEKSSAEVSDSKPTTENQKPTDTPKATEALKATEEKIEPTADVNAVATPAPLVSPSPLPGAGKDSELKKEGIPAAKPTATPLPTPTPPPVPTGGFIGGFMGLGKGWGKSFTSDFLDFSVLGGYEYRKVKLMNLLTPMGQVQYRSQFGVEQNGLDAPSYGLGVQSLLVGGGALMAVPGVENLQVSAAGALGLQRTNSRNLESGKRAGTSHGFAISVDGLAMYSFNPYLSAGGGLHLEIGKFKRLDIQFGAMGFL